jgi:phosphoenolpyruvate carboxylase
MSLGENLAYRDNLLYENKLKSQYNEKNFFNNFKKICDEKQKIEKTNKENKNKETLDSLYNIYKKLIEKEIIYKLQKLVMLNNLQQYLTIYKSKISDKELNNNLLDINKLIKKLKKEVQIYKTLYHN